MKPRKKSWLTTPLAILLVGAALLLGAKEGWFGTTYNYLYITNTTIIQELDDAPPDPTCVLTATPTTANTGDPITATFRDGLNADCAIYMQYNDTGWFLWDTINTGPTGYITVTGEVPEDGTYAVRALCPTCASNEVILTITDPPVAPDDGPPDDGPFPPPPPCSYVCTTKGFVSGTGPYASSSSCTGTQVAEYQSGSSGPICCCTPAGGGSGHAGDGTTPYTTSECNAAKESEGKTSYSTSQTTLDNCAGFALDNCISMGMTLKYADWLAPNCCLWTCEAP